MRRRRILGGLALSAGSLLAADQLVQHTALRDGRLFGSLVAPFEPPIFHHEQWESLARIERLVEAGQTSPSDVDFDAELGWTSPPGRQGPLFKHDWAGCRIGSRPLALHKEPGVRRILTAGDSFVRGDEVEGEDAWPAILDELADDVETANLAVGAYGLDQAYMRVLRDGLALSPDEVWVGIVPQTTLRTVNVYRPALRHWSPSIEFKPRFSIDDEGELRLRPNPVQRLADVPPLLRDQRAFLDAVGHDDFWIERARSAYLPRGESLLHHFATTRLLLTLHEKGRRHGADWLADPKGEVHRLVIALVLAAREASEEKGARFRLLVLPGRGDLAPQALPKGVPYWTALAETLAEQGVEVVDLAPALRAAGAVDDDTLWMPGGHYSPRANRIVAEALLALLGDA